MNKNKVTFSMSQRAISNTYLIVLFIVRTLRETDCWISSCVRLF